MAVELFVLCNALQNARRAPVFASCKAAARDASLRREVSRYSQRARLLQTVTLREPSAAVFRRINS